MTDESYRIGGYGVIFGGADLVGEAFGPDTNYQLDLVPQKPILYDHMLGPVKSALGIWDAAATKIDDVGIWFEGELSRAEQYSAIVDKVMALAHAKKLGLSSGTVDHMAVRDGKAIKQWPIVEVSLTPTPAEPRTLGVRELKALVDALPDLSEVLVSEAAQDSGDAGSDETEAAKPVKSSNREGASKMSEQDTTPVAQAPAVDVTALVAAIGEQIDAKVKPLADQVAAVKAFQDAQAKTPDNDPGVNVPAIHLNGELKHYDNVEPDALALGISILSAAKADGRSKRGASDNAYKALARQMDSEHVLKTEAGRVGASAFKSMGVKANELNYSTQAGYGDEWVGVFYSGQLWESVRQATFVLNMLPQQEVPQGYESMKLPLEGADPTWYLVGQATAQDSNNLGRVTLTVPTSKVGTAAQDLTLKKLGASVAWSGEMEEDSIIPFVGQLRNQLVTSGAETLESVIIDGDTSTSATANINDIAGTPGGTEYWLAVNGFRKIPLVTLTANSRDGGVLDENDFLETVKLMGTAGLAAYDQSRVGFILDRNTHWKALQIPAIKTRDVFSGATLENGRLTSIYGYPVSVSGQFAKATNGLTNTAGKSDLDTAGNNTKGQILAVRWDRWLFGWKRRMTIELERIPRADATEITAMMRFGLIYSAADDAAAISYNLTV